MAKATPPNQPQNKWFILKAISMLCFVDQNSIISVNKYIIYNTYNIGIIAMPWTSELSVLQTHTHIHKHMHTPTQRKMN